jgi:hypothetical protein
LKYLWKDRKKEFLYSRKIQTELCRGRILDVLRIKDKSAVREIFFLCKWFTTYHVILISYSLTWLIIFILSASNEFR